MKMKKVILSLLVALLSVPTFAQLASGGFSVSNSSMYYGVRLGMSFAGISGESNSTNNMKYGSLTTGLTLGGVVGLRLSENTPVFLESGLYYTQRGGKRDKVSVGLNYLEIPLLVKYAFALSDHVAIIPHLGPYFAFAVGGKTKIKDMPDGNGGTHTEKFSSFNDGYFNHSDMGLKLGVGVEWNMLYLEGGYQFGIKNIADDDDLTARNHNIFMNFGVNF